MVKSYNTLPSPAGSEAIKQRKDGQPAPQHLHLFHPAAAGINVDEDVPLLSPFTPADYKTMAMEMAYLTPRRKVPSVRLSSGAGGPEGGAPLPSQFFRSDSRGSQNGNSEHETLVSGPPRPAIVRRQSSATAASPSKLTLILFAASILFLFADQNLLAPNLTAVARDFGFDDAQRDIKLGGQIPFAFFVVGGAVSVVNIAVNEIRRSPPYVHW